MAKELWARDMLERKLMVRDVDMFLEGYAAIPAFRYHSPPTSN